MVGVRVAGLSRVTSPCANTEILYRTTRSSRGGESRTLHRRVFFLQRLRILLPSTHGVWRTAGEAAESTVEHERRPEVWVARSSVNRECEIG